MEKKTDSYPEFEYIKFFILLVVFFSSPFLALFFQENPSDLLQNTITKEPVLFLYNLFLAFFLSLIFTVTRLLFKIHIFSIKKEILNKDELRKSIDTLGDENQINFFNKLVSINFKHIDKYFTETSNQANKAFFSTVGVSMIGFLIIAFGVILLLLGKDNSGYMSVASGTIVEVISALFFKLYNNTVSKMSEYHQKLLLIQNIGLSLKISESLPETEKVLTQTKLIESLTTNINEYLVGKK